MTLGDVEVSNTGLATIDVSDIEFDESTMGVPVTLTIAANPTSADFQVSLSNLANDMNFFIAGISTQETDYFKEMIIFSKKLYSITTYPSLFG